MTPSPCPSAQEETEARRRDRWGHGGHHARWATGAGAVYARAKGGGRHDFLGYYGRLGLDVRDSQAVSEADIRRAFREAALLWHPDRQKARAPAQQTWGWIGCGGRGRAAVAP